MKNNQEEHDGNHATQQYVTLEAAQISQKQKNSLMEYKYCYNVLIREKASRFGKTWKKLEFRPQDWNTERRGIEEYSETRPSRRMFRSREYSVSFSERATYPYSAWEDLCRHSNPMQIDTN